MSGRRLGRLGGSLLLVLAAAAIVAFPAGLFDSSASGAQAIDLIWTVVPENTVFGSGR
ncbi:hypothetical protein PSH03_001011 [Micromonospora sp. PSH03]|uniref:hypothetical protein n=1 Tax=Micromonospora TaxID=1873 RepID=UPI001EE87BC0|nr:hypothetical protein [Micromonospora salmantinae]MCG5456123.1 hypothetical protein [Micromonospora salmantinae]